MTKPVYHKYSDFDVCAECGKKISVQEGYSSRYHFTKDGMWSLLVCEECHKQEIVKQALSGKEKK